MFKVTRRPDFTGTVPVFTNCTSVPRKFSGHLNVRYLRVATLARKKFLQSFKFLSCTKNHTPEHSGLDYKKTNSVSVLDSNIPTMRESHINVDNVSKMLEFVLWDNCIC